jgi:dephospho-CoA kinase
LFALIRSHGYLYFSIFKDEKNKGGELMAQTFTGEKIALCGGIRSGKDTVAEYLVKNYRFNRFAFGDAIRHLCREYFPERMKAGKDRELLQGVGQDLRKYDPDVWVKRTLVEVTSADYEGALDDPSYKLGSMNVVISDLRQPNEYEALRKAGYTIIRVEAAEALRIQRAVLSGDMFRLSDFKHETERHFPTFVPDYEIRNEGSVEALNEQIETVISFMKVNRAKEQLARTPRTGGRSDGSS